MKVKDCPSISNIIVWMHCDQTIVTTMMMMKCVKKILMEVPLPNPHYAADVDADDVDAADADGMEEDDPDGEDHSLLPSPPLPDPGWRRWPSPHSFIIPTSGQLILTRRIKSNKKRKHSWCRKHQQ